MPNNLYSTVEAVRAESNINDAIDDEKIETLIEAVSRTIDRFTWRKFYSTNETRYYTPEFVDLLYIDDITSVDTLKTDDNGDRTYVTSWASTDYDLLPNNALLNNEPFTMIAVAPNGNYGFPKSLAKGVQIKGDFGYITSTGVIPPEIEAACLLGSLRLLMRMDAPLGVSAMASLGQLSVTVRELQTDPDFVQMLFPFRKVI